MKKSIIILTMISMISLMSITVYAVSFTDVSGHWAEAFIQRWAEERIINGYEDNTFQPNNNITRAEYITMIMRIFEPEKKADITGYSDVNASAWYYDTLAKGSAMGAIQGYEDNTMKPDAYITRQEAMVILNRILKLSSSENDNAFVDSNEIASWAKEAVTAFTGKGYINGYEDGTIRPNAFITRAEITKILDKAISKIITASGEYDLNGLTGSVVVKAGNVTLKNEDMIKNVFALNEQVKSSLKAEREVVVINTISSNTSTENGNTENGGNTQSGGESTTPSTDKVYKITLKTNGNKYDVKKEGELVDGAKVSIIADGKTILNEREFSKNNFFQFKLDLLMDLEKNAKKNINVNRLTNTIKESSSESAEDLSKSFMELLSEENQEILQALLDENSGKSISEIYKGLSEEKLMDLAGMILDLDYDKVESLLKNL